MAIFQWLDFSKPVWNRPFAANGHAIQNKTLLARRASYALGNPKKVKYDCSNASPSALFTLQQAVILYHVNASCKGPIVVGVLPGRFV